MARIRRITNKRANPGRRIIKPAGKLLETAKSFASERAEGRATLADRASALLGHVESLPPRFSVPTALPRPDNLDLLGLSSEDLDKAAAALVRLHKPKFDYLAMKAAECQRGWQRLKKDVIRPASRRSITSEEATERSWNILGGNVVREAESSAGSNSITTYVSGQIEAEGVLAVDVIGGLAHAFTGADYETRGLISGSGGGGFSAGAASYITFGFCYGGFDYLKGTAWAIEGGAAYKGAGEIGMFFPTLKRLGRAIAAFIKKEPWPIEPGDGFYFAIGGGVAVEVSLQVGYAKVFRIGEDASWYDWMAP